MDKPLVYIAYQWVGPTGPIGNIRTPDIYDLGMVENHDKVHIQHGSRAAKETFGPNCEDYGNQTGANFKCVSSASMREDDVFMYPITLGHKDHLSMLFDHVLDYLSAVVCPISYWIWCATAMDTFSWNMDLKRLWKMKI